jgi:hypothetical protein
MAKLKWLLVCERAVVEEGSGTISLIGVLEQINVSPSPPAAEKGQPLPVVPQRFAVVQMWTRTDASKPETFVTRVRLFAANGKQFGVSETVVDLSANRNGRVIASAPGLPWAGPGELRIDLQVKKGRSWRTVARERVELMAGPVVPRAASSVRH